MRPNKHDSKGEDLLRELDQLQAAEKRPAEEPPAMIDQAVRNMARRELHGQEHKREPKQEPPISGKLRWIAGLATASIAVIALGIALVQSPQTPELNEPVYPLKKDKSIKEEENRNALQSAASMRSKAAVQPAREADHSAAMEMTKQTAESPATAESAAAAEPLAEAARLSDETFADSAIDQQQANKESPQTWLELIQQLYEQNLTTEAAEQLRDFQAVYPDYPLPDWTLRLQQTEP